MATRMKVALCQMLVGANKEQNLIKAREMICSAKKQGAEFVVLPECFNCPYGTKYFEAYAEPLSLEAPTTAAMSSAAKENGIWLVAGSFPEITSEKKIYNTSVTFDPSGCVVNVHRKVHLFKIFTETLKLDESEVLTPGISASTFPISPSIKVGVGICFDIRFPQMSLAFAAQGSSMIVYPGAFNMVTGPRHWELSARARAVDSQQYVCVCSIARDTSAGYVAWGHSMIVNPWGEVIAAAEEKEAIVLAEVDWSLVTKVRQELPILRGVRPDLYSTWK